MLMNEVSVEIWYAMCHVERCSDVETVFMYLSPLPLCTESKCICAALPALANTPNYTPYMVTN